MKEIKLLLVFFLFLNCNDLKVKEDYSKIIIGDWVTDYFKDVRQNDRVLIFSFEEDRCSYLYPYRDFTDYRINSDTLIIDERKRNKKSNTIEKFYFKVVDVNQDELLLTPLTNKTINLFKYLEGFKLDTIYLNRVRLKLNREIERIGFYSTGCYGSCPSMYLEIDMQGNIMFEGKYFTDKDGLYSGTISKKELEIINEKVNNIVLDSLEKKYSATWTDDQTCGVKIKTKDNLYESSAYGFNKEPVELRLLFHKLMEIYKVADLKQDSTIWKKFEFQQFQYSGYPPPPPME